MRNIFDRYPLLCKDCQYSKPEASSEWNLLCYHQAVIARDAWSLSAHKENGSSCRTEREKGFFSACGKRGKLWTA